MFRGVMIAVALLALASMNFSGPALAQQGDVSALLDRIDRLERDIQTLHQEMAVSGSRPAASGAAPMPMPMPIEDVDGSSPAAARLSVRLATVEQELRGLTGAVEAINHHFDQVNVRLDKLIGDVDFRLSTLEGALGRTPQAAQGDATLGLNSAPPPPAVESVATAPVGAGTGTIDKDGVYVGNTGSLGSIGQSKLQDNMPTPTGDSQAVAPAVSTPPVNAVASVLPAGDAKAQYKFAFGLLGKGKYDQAEPAFQEFIKVHGDNALADNAYYWLGETYYVRKLYTKAVVAFANGYQAFPKGDKAPDILLKLGMSLSAAGKKAEACTTFSMLEQSFPKMSSNIAKTMARERKSNGCS